MKKFCYILFLFSILGPIKVNAQNVGIGTTSPTDQLHSTGTVRFENYRGPGTRTVQIDSSGRLQVTGAGPIFTAIPGATIPDNGCAAINGLASGITVSGLATSVASAKISVRLNITHPQDGDVVALLIAPNGATLKLIEFNGGNSDNFINTIFTDEAPAFLTGSSTTGFPDRYKPKGGLSSSCSINVTAATFGAIGGGTINPNGVWTLRVFDNGANFIGTLNRWQISFSGPGAFETADQLNFIPKFGAGNLVASAIYQAPTGNLGVNTANPAYPFTVNASSNGIVQQDLANGVDMGFYTDGTGGWLQTYTAHPIEFTTANGPSQMELGTNGNIGIGLTGATSRLHLRTAGSALLEMDNSTTLTSGVTNDMVFKTGSLYTGMIRTRGTGTVNAALGFYTNASNSLPFLQERLTIDDGGGIGIGNTSPGYPLDVTGTIHSTLNGNFDGSVNAGSTISAASSISGNSVNAGAGGLSVTGPVTLAAGSPAANKVLTATNAGGTAVWQSPPSYNTAFMYDAGNIPTMANNTQANLPLTNDFNDGNGVSLNAGNTSLTILSTGVYHFDISVEFQNSVTPAVAGIFQIALLKGATTVGINNFSNAAGHSMKNTLVININLKLTAGDVLSVVLSNTTGASGTNVGPNCYFSGSRLY